MRDPITRSGRRRLGSGARAVALVLILTTAAGCSDLLDVDLPGQIETNVLEHPDNAVLLAGAVIAEYECALAKYAAAGGLIGNEFNVSILTTSWFDYDSRRISPSGQSWATATCDLPDPGVYTSLSVVRWLGDHTRDLFSGWTDEQVGNRTAHLARTAAYTGYSFALLGESMCSAVFDEGTEVNAAGILTRAEERFTTALQLAATANLPDIVNMARVGRARARLAAGRIADAGADAALVPAGFVKNANYSAAATRSENRTFVLNNRSGNVSVEAVYRNLSFGGVADTRVKVTDSGRLGADARTPLFLQGKYATSAAPIPISRTAEARLIVAEAALAAGTPDAAVTEINALHTAAGLPPYGGGTPEEIKAQLVEERKRELFLESQHYGDMVRYHIPEFPVVGSPFKFGGVHGPAPACLPLPDLELR